MPVQRILSLKFPYLTGHLQLRFKRAVFQVFSLSRKWSHRIGSLGNPVTNLLEHVLYNDLPWHEGRWKTKFLRLDQEVASLYVIIADGQYRATSLGFET